MNRLSWKLGRVAGIDVFLHPTFLLFLLFVGLSGGGLDRLFLMLAVFGCVLLHELGHALMARQFGIETLDITLLPIGGVARLERMPRAPGAELLIALAGPLVNVAIVMALVLLRGMGLFGGPGVPSPLGLFTDHLLVVNLVLAVFNLIPAFPMDGGRVMRALLSGWLGRVRATSVAAGIGQILAVVFGVISLFQGYWLQVALAWFIYMAAGQERTQVLAEEESFGTIRPANRRWSYRSSSDTEEQGVWTAPPGFQWVRQGEGIWRLAPIAAHAGSDRRPTTWP